MWGYLLVQVFTELTEKIGENVDRKATNKFDLSITLRKTVKQSHNVQQFHLSASCGVITKNVCEDELKFARLNCTFCLTAMFFSAFMNRY